MTPRESVLLRRNLAQTRRKLVEAETLSRAQQQQLKSLSAELSEAKNEGFVAKAAAAEAQAELKTLRAQMSAISQGAGGRSLNLLLERGRENGEEEK